MAYTTEAEAQKKRCPFKMGRQFEYDDARNCIASACMAWRLSTYERGRTEARKGQGTCGLVRFAPDR